MEQLSGPKARLLQAERGHAVGHISMLAIYDGASFAERPYQALRRMLEERLPRVPLMRRRLVEVPFDLDLPYWIEDPDFDLDFHLRHVAVPPPGDRVQLAALVGRMIGRRLDRAHPLWELNLIESIEGGEVALLLKVHHAAIEEGSGFELLSALLDRDPSGAPFDAPRERPAPEPVPDSVALLQRAYATMMTSPQHLVRAQQSALRSVGELFMGWGDAFNFAPFDELRNTVGLAESLRNGVRLPAVPPPLAPFNAPITAHRRIAWRSLPLAGIQQIKRAAATTFTNVVIAICSGGLRRYLERRGELPERSLAALVPILVRSRDAADERSTRVSGAVVDIATHEAEPATRLARIHEAMGAIPEADAALPVSEMAERFGAISSQVLAAQASQMIAGLRVADRSHPPFNLSIANLVGPRDPLYTAGARLNRFLPGFPVNDGTGLSASAASYRDRVDLCLVSCRELVPDLDVLIDDLVAAFDELRGTPLAKIKTRPRRRKSRPLTPRPNPQPE